MNAGPDFERRVSDWLADEMPTRAPDRILPAAFQRSRHTRQRRFGVAWRNLDMNGTIPRFAIAAVIGLLILVGGGIYLGSNGSGDVGGQPTATPIPSPTAAPSATPGPSTVHLTPGQLCSASYCPAGTLEPGTFSIEAGAYSPARLAFTVPAGWASDFDGFVSKHVDEPGEVAFATWDVTHIYADACDDSVAPIAVGTTIEELASALAAQQGHSSSAVADVTLGGFPAKRIEMTLAADACGGGSPRFWPGPGPDLNGGFCCVTGGSTETVYVVDVAGKRVVVVAHHRGDASAADQAELQAVIDSMVFTADPLSVAPSMDTASWTPFSSKVHGYDAAYPATWTATPATRDWSLETDREQIATAGADSFMDERPGVDQVLVTAFSTPRPVSMTYGDWLSAYTAPGAAGTPTTGCTPRDRWESVTVDGHEALLNPDACDASQAFVLIGDRVYVFSVWRPDQAPLLKTFLSTITFTADSPAP